MGAHARFSPSSGRRYLSCPPSLKLEEQFADEQSPYAAEGTPGADGFKHEVNDLVQPVPVKLHILHENVIVDIVLDDLPVNLVCALCVRFLSFPFRRRSRFPVRGRGVRGKDRNGMGTL